MITCIIRSTKNTNSTPGQPPGPRGTEVAALSLSRDTHPARLGSSKLSNTWVPLTRQSSVWAPSNMFLSSCSTQPCLPDTRKVTAWRKGLPAEGAAPCLPERPRSGLRPRTQGF